MELSAILEEINNLFKKILSNDTLSLKMESTANDVDGWDSLNHMSLIAAAEKHFGIKFALKEIMKMKNIQDMCIAIQSKLSK